MQKLLLAFGILFYLNTSKASGMIEIPEGKLVLFFDVSQNTKNKKNQPEVSVKSFKIDKDLVTVKDMNSFLKNRPELQKNKIAKIFVDQRYLEDWSSALLSDEEIEKNGNRPVTYVSWFVAKKYCESLENDSPQSTSGNMHQIQRIQKS